jgi:hypothetical protein
LHWELVKNMTLLIELVPAAQMPVSQRLQRPNVFSRLATMKCTTSCKWSISYGTGQLPDKEGQMYHDGWFIFDSNCRSASY